MSDLHLLQMMRFRDLHIRIKPKKIAFLKFIIEGYDGLALVTTLDRHEGLIRLSVPETRYNELWYLLEELTPNCCQTKQ